MRVGTLVRNKLFPNSGDYGIVIKVINDELLIHWIPTGKLTMWGKYSHDLEVLCE